MSAGLPARRQAWNVPLFHFALFTFHFALCTLLTSASITAAPPSAALPLTAELSSQSPKAIVGRAMPTVWDIRKFQPGLMEGHFEFRVGLKDVEFYRYTTDDIVLSNDDSIHRWLFPPVMVDAVLEEVEIGIVWVGKSGRIALPMQRLIAPTTAVRTVMIGSGENRVSSFRSRAWESRLANLRLESLTPSTQRSVTPAVQSIIVAWDSASVPSDPFTLATCDLVAISSEVFAQLRRPQLDALATWVFAGGRLYVEPSGLMETAHVDFLNRIAPAASGPGWKLDRTGKIEWPVVFDNHLLSTAVGFGRVLIDDPADTDHQPEWEHRLALWEIPVQIPSRFIPWFVTLGTKQGANGQLWPGSRINYDNMNNLPNRMYYQQPAQSKLAITERALQSIVAELMPANVRVIPLRTIILILSVLVFLIGPVDWWVLGRLRLRRFTWLTWPAATVLMTALLIMLSNAYLQSTDRPRALVLHDLAADGHIARSNRFRLEFPRQSRDIVAELRQSVWIPLRATTESVQQLAGLTPQTVQRDVQTLPSYSGRVPQRFEARQAVRQWTPHLSRQFSFGMLDAPPPIDWDKVPLAKYAKTPLEEHRVPDDIVTAIRQQLGENAIVAIFHESGKWSCDAAPLWTAPRVQTVMTHDYYGDGQQFRTGAYPVQNWQTAPTMLSDLIWRLTVPRGSAHNSSTWGENLLDAHLRDIPLLRPDRRDQRVLAVVIPGDTETVIYRRWITGPPPPPQPVKTPPAKTRAVPQPQPGGFPPQPPSQRVIVR